LLCPWVPFRQRINLGKLAAVRRFQDRRLMRCADAVLTNSQFMQGAISERFGINSERIHVFLQACGVEPSKATAPEGTIGFVTRGPEKGLSFVLELARRSPDLRYLVYGHERGRPDTLPSNVDWRGWAADRGSMFASAKLWLVPSLWAEPFGRVSIEAQAADRAVLVGATGGLPETVLENRFQIEGFHCDEWLTRIQALLEVAPDNVRRNGAHIRERFSSKAHDACILGAFDHILSESGDHTHV
ncbi:MAG: glycosyltransferase family 4 protein, partial [Synergistales bacterium]|nr:glycosyltransferase family 4 protein [Synergistales bacterium]